MVTLLIVLVVLGAVAYRVTSPEERSGILEFGRQHLKPVTSHIERMQIATGPFRKALRQRTPWAVVTPTIIGVNVLIFVQILSAPGAASDIQTLVAWGGNLAPRTTNGEWWRLATAMFVHAGVLQFLANIAGLLQLGKMVERLVGPATFAFVYLFSGVFASIASLSDAPLAMHVGASGAIFGIYGLLLAITTWGLIQRNGLRIPLTAFQSLAVTANVFFLYTLATGGLLSAANLTGFMFGLACGLVLVKDIGVRKPAGREVGVAMATAAAIMIAVALPFRGIVDIRPDIAQVVAIEEQTSGPYKAAVDGFRKGRVEARALSDLINETIVPALHAAQARVESLDNVLEEHQPLVSDAQEYLRSREASWKLRAEGLRQGSIRTLREADKTERASLVTLQRLRARQGSPRT